MHMHVHKGLGGDGHSTHPCRGHKRAERERGAAGDGVGDDRLEKQLTGPTEVTRQARAGAPIAKHHYSRGTGGRGRDGVLTLASARSGVIIMARSCLD